MVRAGFKPSRRFAAATSRTAHRTGTTRATHALWLQHAMVRAKSKRELGIDGCIAKRRSTDARAGRLHAANLKQVSRRGERGRKGARGITEILRGSSHSGVF